MRGGGDDFAAAWAAYPGRPNNSRAKAARAWAARIAEGAEPAALLAGVRAYAEYVRRERIEPRFVKQAATFFGPDRHWETDYAASSDGGVRVYDDLGEPTPEFARASGLVR